MNGVIGKLHLHDPSFLKIIYGKVKICAGLVGLASSVSKDLALGVLCITLIPFIH